METITNKTLAEKHLRKFGSFLQVHSRTCLNQLDKEKEEDINFMKSYSKSGDILDGILLGCAPIKLIWSPVSSSSPSLSTLEEKNTASSFEEIICIPLPPEGNPDVGKVLLVLSNITHQLNSLSRQAVDKFINPLLLYGDGFEEEGSSGGGSSGGGGDQDGYYSASNSEGDGHLALSKFVPVLSNLAEWIKAGRELVGHLLSQLGALFKETKPSVVACHVGLVLPTVWRSFGDFLATCIVLDEVIGAQFLLQEHWSKYKSMIASVLVDSGSFGVEDPGELLGLERELFLLEKAVVGGCIYKNMLNDLGNRVRGGGGGKGGGGGGGNLGEKIQSYLVQVGCTLDGGEGNDEGKPLAVAALFVFVASTYSSCGIDWRKVFVKHLQDGFKKVVAVPVGSCVLWIPEVWLNKMWGQGQQGSRLYDAKSIQLATTSRQNYLEAKISTLAKEVSNTSLQVGSWSIRLQAVFYSRALNELKIDDLSKRCNVILQGLKLAQSLNVNFRLIMSLHAHFGKPVSKSVVCLLCQILELLKEVEVTFFRFSVQIQNSILYIVQHVQNTALNNCKSVQKLLSCPELKKMDELRADSLSVMKIFENSMRGPPTEKRLLVAKIALDWGVGNGKFWKGDDAALILPAAIERIGLLLELDGRIGRLCNGCELFWHRIILSTYFSAVYGNEVDAGKLPLMFLIIQDCLAFLDDSPHRGQAKKSFIAEVDGYIKYNLVDKLGQDVETDLRLIAHSHLQGADAQESTSPFRVGVKEHQYLFMCPTLAFEGERSVNFRMMTEYYLSKTFYNLASVALHDWQSYATMRALAAEKYNLDVGDDHLPGHSLEQGRDVLEIVRNLPKFVQEFTYNLNNQVFIQVSSPNKHLDTVNIRHLANSMRTHGIGMTNTTVNAAYQFLRPKMHLFSQCLYEEQIRSRLAKDIRLFKITRQEPSSGSAATSSQPTNFPFKVAEKFKKGIKKLGVQDGLTWLDKFRILISHIGNALGFVRLVRSGGLHYLAGGCRFIPDLDDISGFSGGEKGVPSEIYCSTGEGKELKVAKQLELAVKGVDSTLTKFFGGEDYFRLLVKAFRAGCLQEKNAHLKNFHVIIPALTLSYVDHMRQCKEMLAKKSKSATIFTDDGFPMGVAYLLQVLDQDDDFDSLGWFASVKSHYEEEKRRETQIITESKNDEKLEQTSKLTAKRFHDQLQEFELLRFNLSSARIFFQYNEPTKKL